MNMSEDTQCDYCGRYHNAGSGVCGGCGTRLAQGPETRPPVGPGTAFAQEMLLLGSRGISPLLVILARQNLKLIIGVAGAAGGLLFLLNELGRGWLWAIMGIVSGLAFQVAFLWTGAKKASSLIGVVLDLNQVVETAGIHEPSDSVGCRRFSPQSPDERQAEHLFCRYLPVFIGASLMIFAISHYLWRERPQKELRQYQEYAGVFVTGSLEFQKNVCGAMALLRRALPDKFAFVTDHVCVVIQVENSEWGHAKCEFVPTVIAFAQRDVSDLQWCAAGLVHEAMHFEQVRRSRGLNHGGFVVREVAGTNAEIEANAIATETLRQLGAPKQVSDYVEADRGAHFTHWVSEQSKRGTLDPAKVEESLLDKKPRNVRPLKEFDPKLWEEILRFSRTCRDPNLAKKMQGYIPGSNGLHGGFLP
jgi:hypothetical protein